MILYVIGIIILFIILFFIYIRLKYKFWAIQPVFHFYDIYYWFKNVGIINKELPKKNKYTNFTNIETNHFEKISNKQLKQFIFLIQNNYLKNGDNNFDPQINNIVPYFTGNNHICFFSFYYEKNLLEDIKNKTTINDKKLIGAITSRPLSVWINNNNNNNNTFDVYYVDYLCVDKMYRKKNIAPQLIQTHEYNQSHQNKKISVSLFKREDVLTGIIPICVYSTYGFNMKNWTTPNPIPIPFSLLSGDQQNLYYLYNFIKDIKDAKDTKKKWKLIILPQISNLLELVKTKNIYIQFIITKNEIKSVYFFRKTCTSLNKDKKIISLFASIQGDITNELFINGFKYSLSSIVKKDIFHYLSIEDISDNNIIINNLKIKTNPEIISPTAYFFYNFAYETFPSNKVLIVN